MRNITKTTVRNHIIGLRYMHLNRRCSKVSILLGFGIARILLRLFYGKSVYLFFCKTLGIIYKIRYIYVKYKYFSKVHNRYDITIFNTF